MQASNWLMPAVVLGLIVGLLMAAALVRRYQQHKAQQRVMVRRIASLILLIEHALTALSTVPLARDLRVSLRREILQGYQRIQKVHPRYPHIGQRVHEAQARLDSEGPDSTGSVPPIGDEEQYSRLLSAVDQLLDHLKVAGLAPDSSAKQRALFAQHLGERRAEIMARYHIVQAHRCEERRDVRKARQHLQTLLSVLQRRGPNTDFVRELFHEAEQMQSNLGRAATQHDSEQNAQSLAESFTEPLRQAN